MSETIHVTPSTESSTTKALKIVGIVLLAGVALCGLAGTCLLLITFLIPATGH